MIKKEKSDSRSEAGFTLVELAIVMIIIGLLIGGVLKGQELIGSAKITATITKVRSIDVAVTTFRDLYNGIPGDILAPDTRLPNCAVTTPCGVGGNGDGRIIGTSAGASPAAIPAVEVLSVFSQLAAADLISGVTGLNVAEWGNRFPAAEVGGGFYAAYYDGSIALGAAAVNIARAGHYLALVRIPDVVGGNNAVSSIQAFRIDGKLDDGIPNTGSVLAGNAGCDGAAAGAYSQVDQSKSCDLLIRFQ